MNDLEKQIDGPGSSSVTRLDGDRPHSHATALQRELESVKERKKKREAELESELNIIKTELANLKNKQTGNRTYFRI